MNYAQVITNNMIHVMAPEYTYEMNKKDFREKFVYHDKTYFFCFNKSIFHKSTFFKMLLIDDDREFDDVYNNFVIALDDTILDGMFDSDYFAKMIYTILYNSSLTKKQKISCLSPNEIHFKCTRSGMNQELEKEILFLCVHQALYKVLIIYYGFGDEVEEILRESFLNFLRNTKNFIYHSTEYFGMHFSRRVGTRSYAYKKKQINEFNPIEVDLAYKRTYPDVKYIRFCFEKASFEFSQHFLLCVNNNDPCLAIIDKYIRVEMNFLNKKYNFFHMFFKHVHGKKLMDEKNLKKIKKTLSSERASSDCSRSCSDCSLSCSDSDDYEQLEDCEKYGFSKLQNMESMHYFFSINRDYVNYNVKCEFYINSYSDLGYHYIGGSDTCVLDTSNMDDFADKSLFGLNFTEVILPKKMKILTSTFDSVRQVLTSLILPPDLEEIGNDFLCRSMAMKKLELPKTLKKIGRDFLSNSVIETLEFNEGLESIDDGCLYNCSKINHIYIPDSLKNIGRASSFRDDRPNKMIKTLYFGMKPEDHPLFEKLKKNFTAYGVKFLVHPSKIPTFRNLVNLYHDNKFNILNAIDYDWFDENVKNEKDKYVISFPEIYDDTINISMEKAFVNFLETGELPNKEDVLKFTSNSSLSGYTQKDFVCDPEKIKTFSNHIMQFLGETSIFIDDFPLDMSQLVKKFIPMEHLSTIYNESCSSYDEIMYSHKLTIWSYGEYFIFYDFTHDIFTKHSGSISPEITIEEYEDFTKSAYYYEGIFLDHIFGSFRVFRKDDKDSIMKYLTSENSHILIKFDIISIGCFLSKIYQDINQLKVAICEIALQFLK